MAKVNLKIDGHTIEADSSRRLLDVAHEHGIDIPTLCHDPRLEPFGACRLCLVEVKGARGPVASCGAAVSAGMEVTTDSESLRTLRRMALELLLSEHHGDCVAPCQLACPAGIDIQGFVAHIANGAPDAALRLIKEQMPLPAICGRVCPKFCEVKCRRNVVDSPVAICWLKRYAADIDLEGDAWCPEVASPTGKRVAVVGGGPAGLTAAYYLAILGHEVTILDSSPQLGGMMRYGIPAYRLPREVLDREIATITRLCKEVRLGVALGRDFSLQSLRTEGYDAVVAALGAQANQDMDIVGEQLDGVWSGIGFLRQLALGEEVTVGRRVGVIGGGNTAMDAARNALRRGADKVTVIYRRSEREMPASHEEVEQARDEGIEFLFLTAPVAFNGADGKVSSVRCVKMELGAPDASGRRRPEPVSGSESDFELDTVVVAVGQKVDASSLCGVDTDRWGCVVTDRAMRTSVDWLFAAGDCVTGPKTVVEAVGAAHEAARAVDLYLRGEQVVPEVRPYNASRGELEDIEPEEYAEVERLPRAEMPMRPAQQRRRDYEEVELGFDGATSTIESGRCLSCGCEDVFDCKLRDLATEYGAKDRFGAGRFRHAPADDHPYIIRDPNKCILCGNCVRICAEVQDVAAFGFVGRASLTEVRPALDLPLAETLCESCTQCVSACPTGALSTRTFVPKPGPWQTDTVDTSCPHCGLGCELQLSVAGGQIIRASAPPDGRVGRGNLCKLGAFGFRFTPGQQRLTAPLVKRDGRFEATSWEDALTLAASGLREAWTRGRPALLASSKLTLEQAMVAREFARTTLEGADAWAMGERADHTLATVFGTDGSTCGFDAIDGADLILVYGTDLAGSYPVLANRVRAAIGRGLVLVSINSHRTRLDAVARATVGVNVRKAAQVLELMLDYVLRNDLIDREFVDEHVERLDDLRARLSAGSLARLTQRMWTKPEKVIEILHLYLRARNPVIIVDGSAVSGSELGLLADLAAVTGNVGRSDAGMCVLRRGGNSQGLIAAGFGPAPNGVSPSAAVVVSTGDFPGGDYPTAEFVVVLAPAVSGGFTDADVVLPTTAFWETDGTQINSEGRRRQIRRAAMPVAGRDACEVLAELACALDRPLDAAGAVTRAAAVPDEPPNLTTIRLHVGFPAAEDAAAGD